MKPTLMLSALLTTTVACGPLDPTPTAPVLDTTTQAQGGVPNKGGGRFEFGANDAYWNPQHALGEPSISGWVVVSRFFADTVVTMNGVPLMREPYPFNGLWWRVDPAGPQPVVGASGTLTISVSSASGGLSRALTFACAADAQIDTTPAVGSSLAGRSSLSLSWQTDITAHDTAIPVQELAQASLFGFDPATNTLGAGGSPVYLGAHLTGATLPVGIGTSPGWVVDLRWPGQYLLDGNSGGQCGRVKRLPFAR